jgi:hypothetical protein
VCGNWCPLTTCCDMMLSVIWASLRLLHGVLSHMCLATRYTCGPSEATAFDTLTQGHCRNGGRCTYAHMHSVTPRAPICPDFLRGFCPNRDRCSMKHFTQRALNDYFMRPQEYESMLLAAERTWGTRCDPASDSEDILPSSCALDSMCAQGARDELAGDEGDRCCSRDNAAQSEDSQQGGTVHAAADYIRLTAAHGGFHIGGISFPGSVLEQ